MNRGARGWEPKVKVTVGREGPRVVQTMLDFSDLVEPVDMIEVNGVWMTKEDANDRTKNNRRA